MIDTDSTRRIFHVIPSVSILNQLTLPSFPCVVDASVYVSKARPRTVLPMGNVNENYRGSNVTSVSTNVTSILVIV